LGGVLGGEGWGSLRKEEVTFLKKSNQKTFGNFGSWSLISALQSSKGFFASPGGGIFFEKK
jgi:hypothetical protein